MKKTYRRRHSFRISPATLIFLLVVALEIVLVVFWSNIASFINNQLGILWERRDSFGVQAEESENTYKKLYTSFLENHGSSEGLESGQKVRVLSAPPYTSSDTLIVEAGLSDGILSGEKVLGNGGVLIGEVTEVYQDSSKVLLESYSGNEAKVRTSEGSVQEVRGQGGGTLVMVLPIDFPIEEGETVTESETGLPLARVVNVVPDDIKPTKSVYLSQLLNPNYLEYVYIR